MKKITKRDLIEALKDVDDNAIISIATATGNWYITDVFYDEYANDVPSIIMANECVANTSVYCTKAYQGYCYEYKRMTKLNK